MDDHLSDENEAKSGLSELPWLIHDTGTSNEIVDLFGDGQPSSPTESTLRSASSFEPDPYAVSEAEALSYYAGLPSEPILIYRTGKPWYPPRGLEVRRRTKELRPVFNHDIVDLWSSGLGSEVVEVMDTHKIFFTTIDVVRFKTDKVDEAHSDEDDGEELKPAIGPVTIWIGVFPDYTRPSLAYKAAQDVLALLNRHKITDVEVEFRASLYTHESGPRLLSPVSDFNPLVDAVSPLTPALGLGISTKASPTTQGTMALYLNGGDGKNSLLGLTCRHVLMSCKEGNIDFVYHPHAPPKNVVLLGKQAYTDLTSSIQLKIVQQGMLVGRWKEMIDKSMQKEKGTDKDNVAMTKREQTRAQTMIDNAEETIEAFEAFLGEVKTHWKKLENRILGPIIRSPAIRFGVGDERFTEDWGVFRLDRDKLGDGFQGNVIDLGTKMWSAEFTQKCFPRGEGSWSFKYPETRLLRLQGTLTDQLMRHPDMWDSDLEPCLLVVKNGNATGTTLGRANGVFSIIRVYFSGDMAISRTSMEWGIINYNSKSEIFSGPGDSGSIIADIRGRIGGMLTGGASKTESSDITYATPF
ncbi:hypothetical protein GGR54DRAFT_643047 [Hypoxylon sp. NC1633]|nr:hypothetical protein GGR54DRAFT_643047 [Hypoxylon sp. NC1633]